MDHNTENASPNSDMFPTSTAEQRMADQDLINKLKEEYFARGGKIELIEPTRSRLEKKYNYDVPTTGSMTRAYYSI